MAGSVNKAIIIGNLGNEPEVRTFQDGGQICTFSVATSENWKDRNTGERRERTEWHRIVIRSEGLIRVVQQYVHKGSKVYIEGKLQTRKWQDQGGQDRYTTEIVVGGFDGTLTMLDGRGGGAEGGGIERGGQRDDDFGGGQGGQGGPGGPGGGIDDEIPF